MTNLKNLEQQKTNLEYAIKQLQENLEVVNNLIEQEKALQEKEETKEITTDQEITVAVEVKETAKTTTYIHTVKQGETEIVRKSKKKYDYAMVVVDKETGKLLWTYGYRNKLESAENECASWNSYCQSKQGQEKGHGNEKAIVIAVK